MQKKNDSQNKNISIAIPTYNRCDVIKNNLKDIIKIIGEFNIPIYVSDNCSPDNTYEELEKLKTQYKYLHVQKNSSNLGPDRNTEKALKMAQTEYVWLMSDDDSICSEKFNDIYKLVCENKYDLIVLNGENRVKNIKSKVYSDLNDMLSDIGWHMTFMSCLIYSKSLLKQLNFEKYYDSKFLQTGTILDCLSKKSEQIKIFWLSDLCIGRAQNADYEASWMPLVFDIFIVKWSNLILSQSMKYKLDVKLKCIKDHGINTSLFTYKGFIFLRQFGHLNFKNYNEYKRYLHLVTNVKKIYIVLLLLIPTSLINLARKIFRFVRYRTNR